MNNSSKGGLYEALVLEKLLAQGYELVKQNYRSSRGEIDLIMYDKTLSPKSLVFIEVKYRASEQFGSALESVTAGKRQKIVHTANVFLMKNPHSGPCRFDVIGISSSHQLTHIKNAFESFC
jgi:putative endonuclease